MRGAMRTSQGHLPRIRPRGRCHGEGRCAGFDARRLEPVRVGHRQAPPEGRDQGRLPGFAGSLAHRVEYGDAVPDRPADGGPRRARRDPEPRPHARGRPHARHLRARGRERPRPLQPQSDVERGQDPAPRGVRALRQEGRHAANRGGDERLPPARQGPALLEADRDGASKATASGGPPSGGSRRPAPRRAARSGPTSTGARARRAELRSSSATRTPSRATTGRPSARWVHDAGRLQLGLPDPLRHDGARRLRLRDVPGRRRGGVPVELGRERARRRRRSRLDLPT